MLIGYNTNVKYKGKTYHIQTEDSGPNSHQIITLLYYQGAILSSKKTNYAHLLGEPDFENKLRTLMKEQHRDMIRELKRIAGHSEGNVSEKGNDKGETSSACNAQAGETSEIKGSTDDKRGPEDRREEKLGDNYEPSASESSDSRTKKGLDDILINYIISRRDKK